MADRASAGFDTSELSADPIIVVDGDGRVLQSNKAARSTFGGLDQGDWLGDKVATNSFGEAKALSQLLRSFAAQAQPVRARLDLLTPVGERSFTIMGARLGAPSCGLAIGLYFSGATPSQFSALTDKIAALNREIGDHRVARRQLEAALDRNLTLYRELQHRVKNHLQMIMGMLGMERRRTETQREREIVDVLDGRVSAIAEVQRMLHDMDAMDGLPANIVIDAVCTRLQSVAGATARIRAVSVDDLLPNDVASALALILNELVSSAVKHARDQDQAAVQVSFFKSQEGDHVLAVQDDGPGFGATDAGGKGWRLRLVDGLSRQIGARLVHVGAPDARSELRFTLPDARAVA